MSMSRHCGCKMVRSPPWSERCGRSSCAATASASFGDFELRFAPHDAGTPADDTSPGTASGTPLSLGGSLAAGSADSTAAVGQLRDLSGPLSLQAQVLLTRQNGYQVSGTLMARAAASSELAQAAQLLGPADSEGKRSFSFAGKL